MCLKTKLLSFSELGDSVQKMTDKFIKKVDEAVEVKSKEILTV